MTITGMISEIEASQGIVKKKCVFCVHVKVCAHYKANKNFLSNLPEHERPWNPDDIAQICRFFKLNSANGR